MDEFHGAGPPQQEMFGEIDLAHAAGAQGSNDAVVGDDVASKEGMVHGEAILAGRRGSSQARGAEQDRCVIGIENLPDGGRTTQVLKWA